MPSPDAPARPADARHRATLGNRFRFAARVLALVGVVAAAAGLFVRSGYRPDRDGSAADQAAADADLVSAALDGGLGTTARVAAAAGLAGVAVVALWLLSELAGAVTLVTGRRTAAQTNLYLQAGLAVLLLVLVNAVSFRTHDRADLTTDKRFTLDPKLVDELRSLRADRPTTIVVLQLHKTAGTLTDKPDAYDYAAERKVVEKVTDLVGQLRELGPRFNVVVLDVEDEGYERAVRALTRRRPGLADAIAAAQENSIFFYADEKVRPVERAEADRLALAASRPAAAPDPDDPGRTLVYPGAVTRLGFAAFYQLDKTSSREPTPGEREAVAPLAGGAAYAPAARGKGNLVLIPRGNEAFVRKVIDLEARRPRVGLAVVDPVLTSTDDQFDPYTAAGLRAALTANGYEVADVVLKRELQTPAADTPAEGQLDSLENEYFALKQTLAVLGRRVPKLDADLRAVAAALELANKADTADQQGPHMDRMIALLQPYIANNLRLTRANLPDALPEVVPQLTGILERDRRRLADAQKAVAEVEPRYLEAAKDERAVEGRRRTDVKAKLRQFTADCDVLVVPRITTVDLTLRRAHPAAFFDLTDDQALAVKEFLKAGKPVLFAFGPTNTPAGGFPRTGDDPVERLLPQLGIELGRQTIVTGPEAAALDAARGRGLGGPKVKLPAISFDPAGDKPEVPVSAAFRVSARAADDKLEVRKSGFRPVYLTPAGERLPTAGVIAYSPADSWNEDDPLPATGGPKFEGTPAGDPRRGTHDEERQGPFPVGVAVETEVPIDWYDPDPDAAAGLAGGAATLALPAPGYGPRMAAAGLALPFDGGLTALGLTLAADQKPRTKVRVIALGHGGLFTGKRLDPAAETLLLASTDWLLKRDDRLPRDVPEADKWRYPRAELAPQEARAWQWGTAVGLPLLVAVCGLIALMVRQVR